jgi:hypothetical protein
MELPMDGSSFDEEVMQRHDGGMNWKSITFIYVGLAFCFISPPTAFITAGVTVQGLFGSLLGNPVCSLFLYCL